MAKIRHISYRAEDVDAMAKFFVVAIGMTMIQRRKDNSIDLSDGSVNISILPLAVERVSTISVFPPRTTKNKSAG
jgi:hypothetical protein